ncbi:hypothetical protein SAMN04487914_12646 [Arthrobacter sp. ok909]|nr:hypothetical protein SAMN04487914_12646 [Arthrobacter sp. ok909]
MIVNICKVDFTAPAGHPGRRWMNRRDMPLARSGKGRAVMVGGLGGEHARREVIDPVGDVIEGVFEGFLGAQTQRIRH